MAKYILPNVDYGRDLNASIPDAPDFKYWEFVSSETAIRHNIKNIPNEQQWQNIELLAKKVLQPLRLAFGKAIKINSGFRNPILSALVGSSSSSNHCRGEAADIEFYDDSGVSLKDLGEFIALNYAFHELIFEFMPHGWIHVAYRANSRVKTIKLKDSQHHYTKMSLEEILEIL